jgi:polyisoprenoid-binding protein YceI
MKKLLLAAAFSTAALTSGFANAADYQIDIKGAHAFVNFKIQHLGYSWLTGRFNKFDGQFQWDAAKPEASSIEVTIDTASIDSNHAERDKHLRGGDFLNVKKFPTATFKSTSYKPTGKKSRCTGGRSDPARCDQTHQLPGNPTG